MAPALLPPLMRGKYTPVLRQFTQGNVLVVVHVIFVYVATWAGPIGGPSFDVHQGRKPSQNRITH